MTGPCCPILIHKTKVSESKVLRMPSPRGPFLALLLVSFNAAAGLTEREHAAELVHAYFDAYGGSLEQPPAEYPLDIADATRICGYCHGQDGNSTHTEIPSLAAQNPLYFVEQLLVFHNEGRYPVLMHGMAKQLDDVAKVAAALYYAALPRNQTMPVDAQKAQAGKPLYEGLCIHCHGPSGHGASEIYANISSQRPDYLGITMQRFRDRSGKRKSHEMGAIVGGLSDAEIESLAHYVASLPHSNLGE